MFVINQKKKQASTKMTDKFCLIKSLLVLLVVFLVNTRNTLCESSGSELKLSDVDQLAASNEFGPAPSIRNDDDLNELAYRYARNKLLKYLLRHELNRNSEQSNESSDQDEQSVSASVPSNNDFDEFYRALDRKKKNSLKTYQLKRGMKTMALGFGK